MARLPAELPERLPALWSVPLHASGLGGIAVADQRVVFGDRDLDDLQDVYQCLDARSGELLWVVRVVALGQLDYGNSPRATPLIADGRVFLCGALGDLLCVDLATGKTLWQRNLRQDFAVTAEMPWGFCGSPLLVAGKLVVSPGGPQASLVALRPETGEVIWQTPGAPAGHGSFVAGEFGGRWQVIGHDVDSLGGWDPASGKRLWRLVPPAPGDFNVPTPVAWRGQLIVATENNGTRLYGFRADGTLDPQPRAENRRLAPSMSTPVVAGTRLFCVHRQLVCLDLQDGLRERLRQRDSAFGDYAAALTDDQRVLLAGRGELVLVDATATPPRITSRCRVSSEETELYAHPALVGPHLYLRSESSLLCLPFVADPPVP